jgi:hypothetical protein
MWVYRRKKEASDDTKEGSGALDFVISEIA